MKITHFKTKFNDFYRICPFPGLTGITAQIMDYDIMKNKIVSKKEINWFACGACTIEETKQFIQALQKAVDICEKGGEK